VQQNTAKNEFPRRITFDLQAQSLTQITSVRLVYRVGDDPVMTVAAASFTPGFRFDATYQIDLRREYLPPGVTIQYRWQIRDLSNANLTTDGSDLWISDPRFVWRGRRLGAVTLYWHDVDDQFAHVLLDTAAQALTNASTATGLPVTRPVQVLVYGNGSDFKSALGAGVNPWVGGQTFALYGVSLLLTPPNDVVAAQKNVAHEVTHVVIDSTTEDPFGPLPTWLDEGLAMVVSAGDPGPTFRQALQNALRGHHLMSIQSLSGSFPEDTDRATLAYAESNSLVRYFEQRYGREKLTQLIAAFRQGETSDEAFRQGIGRTTRDFQRAWEASLSSTTTPATQPASGSPILKALTAAPNIVFGLLRDLLHLLRTTKGQAA